ncbi:MAG: hypothetical protein ACI8UZ_001754 [Akkermansiaceae bacterium]|jgi:hypothetical protein
MKFLHLFFIVSFSVVFKIYAQDVNGQFFAPKALAVYAVYDPKIEKFSLGKLFFGTEVGAKKIIKKMNKDKTYKFNSEFGGVSSGVLFIRGGRGATQAKGVSKLFFSLLPDSRGICLVERYVSDHQIKIEERLIKLK